MLIFLKVMLISLTRGTKKTSIPHGEKDWRSRKTGTETAGIHVSVIISIYATFVAGGVTVRGEQGPQSLPATVSGSFVSVQTSVGHHQETTG